MRFPIIVAVILALNSPALAINDFGKNYDQILPSVPDPGLHQYPPPDPPASVQPKVILPACATTVDQAQASKIIDPTSEIKYLDSRDIPYFITTMIHVMGPPPFNPSEVSRISVTQSSQDPHIYIRFFGSDGCEYSAVTQLDPEIYRIIMDGMGEGI